MALRLDKSIVRGILSKIKRRKEETYSSIVNANAPWVFVSYIATVFYHKDEEQLLMSHQNNRETLVIAKTFNDMGYNVFFMQYNSTRKLPDIDCKLVFGHEPNFARACEKYKNANKIYYGVSTYYEYRNQKIVSMTSFMNERFACNVPLRRLVSPHNSLLYAEKVLLIGSNRTIETFPEQHRSKITLIKQSAQCPLVDKVCYATENEFFFMAGGGNALKGVAVLIAYFAEHKDRVLHWLGPVEQDVAEAIKPYVGDNVHIYGFLSTSDPLVLQLMKRCNFMIYPSGVEGGVPGSVLNAMKNGLIPLVTPWSSFDGIEEYGYVMKDADVQSVGQAIEWAMSKSVDEITALKVKCAEYSRKTYTIENYERDFRAYMNGILLNLKE